MQKKLNYKRTLLVGFAFFLICAFWQAYDNMIPKILTDKFGLSQTWSGFLMALDNIFALFLLPFFGALSDKSASKRGKRTPFIVVGTVLAALLFVALSFTDSMQLAKIKDVATVDDPGALEVLYDAEADVTLKTPDGESFVLSESFTRESFSAIRSDSAEYTRYVVPARQAYAWQKTVTSPETLVFFILLLLCVLVSMGIFRSPAVALMPDITPKPFRSKANAIINLMGSVGGILVIVLGMIFGTGKSANALMAYTPFFAVVSGVMLISLGIFILTVREVQWSKEAEEWNRRYDADNSDAAEPALEEGKKDAEPAKTPASGKLPKAEFRSLLLILASVALWYMGYNAVISKYSVYAGKVLSLDYNATLLIAQAAAILSYLPIGILSSRFGRKKTILAGVLILAISFGGASFMRAGSPVMVMNLLFALAGIGWATINVNSYPMVVELARGGDVGKYTGFYYTASMAAQVVTPILSGFFLDIRFTSLFPYATLFVIASFITMCFVRHGDAKPEKPKVSVETFGQD